MLLSQSWPVSFSIQGSNSCFLTCTQDSQETGRMVCYSHHSKSFPQFVLIYTVKGFSIVEETEADVFLKFPCFLYIPWNVANLTSSSSSFSKLSLDIWKFPTFPGCCLPLSGSFPVTLWYVWQTHFISHILSHIYFLIVIQIICHMHSFCNIPVSLYNAFSITLILSHTLS